MYLIETEDADRHQIEEVTAAFLRFLADHNAPAGADTAIHTEVHGAKLRCRISLWSWEAAEEFLIFLRRFELPTSALPKIQSLQVLSAQA